MKLHILGICGTFMGGLAAIARASGHRVEGSDLNVYPPMSEQLEQLGICLYQGYDPVNISEDTDCVIIGNALSRGNLLVEYVLNEGLNYTSGPEWLANHLLKNRQVIAVAGTHGKTTTSSMIAWILESAGEKPGFLIGGIPENFSMSARCGEGKYFVIEADEYDTAFFDKRSKFVHYHANIAVLNNLEFDHADIFNTIFEIQKQFHHFVRTVPSNGHIVCKKNESTLDEVLAMGCWSNLVYFSNSARSEWQATALRPDCSQFQVTYQEQFVGECQWNLIGEHNVNNALAAIAAVAAAGIKPQQALQALQTFKGVKRRLTLLAETTDLIVYEDFAHHPTAIETTLNGLRASNQRRLIVVIDPASNTMKSGLHLGRLSEVLGAAERIFFLDKIDLQWDMDRLVSQLGPHAFASRDSTLLLDKIAQAATPGSTVVFMSNGGFEQIPSRFVQQLNGTETPMA